MTDSQRNSPEVLFHQPTEQIGTGITEHAAEFPVCLGKEHRLIDGGGILETDEFHRFVVLGMHHLPRDEPPNDGDFLAYMFSKITPPHIMNVPQNTGEKI